MKTYEDKTLDELDPVAAENSDYDSNLVRTCHRLRKKAIGDMSVEDLRILIGQRIGLQYLLPSAVAFLKEDPLAEGDYYEGDLLMAVLRAINSESTFIKKYSEQLKNILSELKTDDTQIMNAVAEFERNAA